MTWSIHHINVPSSNVRRDADFFRRIIGLTDGKWTYPPEVGDLHHDEDGIAYFGIDNCGLHVVRLIPQFATEQGFHHNPTVGGHIALNIDDISAFMARCAGDDILLSDAGTYAMAGVHQTYVFDPAGNLIEVNATVQPLPANGQSPDAAVSISHIVLPAHDLELSGDFYSDIVGLGPAARSSPGHLHYEDRAQSVHVAQTDPDFPGDHNPTVCGCFGMSVDDLDTIVRRLAEAGHAFSDIAVDPLTGDRVVYAFTPSARLLALSQSS